MNDDPLGCARGIMVGMVLSIAIWLTIWLIMAAL